MRRKTVALLILLSTTSVSSQQTNPTWLFPSDGALSAAAKRAYEGGRGAKVKPFTPRVSSKCGKVDQVQVLVPIQGAFSIGLEKRKKFEPEPTMEELLVAKGRLAINVVLLPDDRETDAEAALAIGDKMLKAAHKEEYMREIQQRGCAITLYQPNPRWVAGIIYYFEFQPSQSPPSGQGKLLVRLSDGKEEDIEIDFDKLAAAANKDIQ